MSAARDPLGALGSLLRTAAAQPLVTYYDAGSGERIELSAVTADNWVNKIANFLADELLLDPGSRIAIELPAHWQTAVVTLGAWAAGLTIVPPTQPLDIRVVGPEGLATYDRQPPMGIVVACSLRPLGGRFTAPLPEGWLDFAAEVPPQPDLLLEPRPMADPAVTLGQPLSPAGVLRLGAEAAASVGLVAGGRLLTDLNPANQDGLIRGLAACLAVGGSLVLIAGGDDEARSTVARQERATCTLWAEQV
jgi:uncharacterized protein (TIGR03089 family)